MGFQLRGGGEGGKWEKLKVEARMDRNWRNKETKDTYSSRKCNNYVLQENVMRSRWFDVDVKMRLHVLLWCYIISIFIIILKMKMMLYNFFCALLLTLIWWRWRYYVLWCSSPWKVQDVTKKFFLRSVKPGSRYYVILPDVMWCHVICSACSVWKRRWCHVMLCDFMWCWFMWCHVMFCDAAPPPPSEWIGC